MIACDMYLTPAISCNMANLCRENVAHAVHILRYVEKQAVHIYEVGCAHLLICME